jgi:hypothetical protein
MRRDIIHFFNGVHYEFPLCCVFFFMAKINSSYMFTDEKWYHPKNDGYIRCPECILKELKNET